MDQAIARLPAEIAAATARATPRAWSGGLCVRCYSAGCTDFAWDAGARNIGFAVVARSNAQIHAAISKVMVAADCWQPQAWLAVVGFADALVRWFQQLCLADSVSAAEPKTLRLMLWHTPARFVGRASRRVVRGLDTWARRRDPCRLSARRPHHLTGVSPSARIGVMWATRACIPVRTPPNTRNGRSSDRHEPEVTPHPSPKSTRSRPVRRNGQLMKDPG
ncbi:MAG: hypothetical protein M3360_01095 [Actinomycetota bacterium]|nr:hypothetical protein [Actinomycetota bacterium]